MGGAWPSYYRVAATFIGHAVGGDNTSPKGRRALYILDYIVLNDTPLFGSVKIKYYLRLIIN